MVKDFPVDFYAGVDSLKTGIIIPKPSLQKKLLNVISSDTYQALHQPEYSVVANPANLGFQNCTEHTLDVLVSAVYETDNPQQIKANIAEYFTPQEISLNPLESLFGPVFVKDFTKRDQDVGIKTATYTTIANFMKQYDLASEIYELQQN